MLPKKSQNIGWDESLPLAFPGAIAPLPWALWGGRPVTTSGIETSRVSAAPLATPRRQDTPRLTWVFRYHDNFHGPDVLGEEVETIQLKEKRPFKKCSASIVLAFLLGFKASLP